MRGRIASEGNETVIGQGDAAINTEPSRSAVLQMLTSGALLHFVMERAWFHIRQGKLDSILGKLE